MEWALGLRLFGTGHLPTLHAKGMRNLESLISADLQAVTLRLRGSGFRICMGFRVQGAALGGHWGSTNCHGDDTGLL